MPRKKIVIDLGERYKNAFGFVARKQSGNLEKKGFQKETGISSLGVFVTNNISFEDITLSGGGFTLEFGHTELSKDGSMGKVFAPPPMVSFSQSKIIGETGLDGTNGELVERYGYRNWDITIQGILVDTANHEYPSEQVATLRKVFQVNKEFDVSCQIFDDLDIKFSYFEKIDIAGVQGFADTMQFTLSGRSLKQTTFKHNQFS